MTRGGKRTGAGRPKKEPTVRVRVPESKLAEVNALVGEEYAVPLYASRVQAGFPSPADDYMEAKLDLNQYLIKRPAATFLVRAQGDSMINAGIFEGDIMVVDRSIKPTDGKIVIAVVDGELTVKRLVKGQLRPENDAYDIVAYNPEDGFSIWGVVTNVIHHV